MSTHRRESQIVIHGAKRRRRNVLRIRPPPTSKQGIRIEHTPGAVVQLAPAVTSLVFRQFDESLKGCLDARHECRQHAHGKNSQHNNNQGFQRRTRELISVNEEVAYRNGNDGCDERSALRRQEQGEQKHHAQDYVFRSRLGFLPN